MVRALLFGLAFAVAGGFSGLFVFIVLVRRGWFDGPGGGMALFPLLLIPAVGFGLYGFSSTLAKSRKRRANSK